MGVLVGSISCTLQLHPDAHHCAQRLGGASEAACGLQFNNGIITICVGWKLSTPSSKGIPFGTNQGLEDPSSLQLQDLFILNI
eukprot:scaffold717_cov402-Pavlova_lutheri.AAC.1